MDDIRAQLKYLRIAPKKVRRIASLLKGMGYLDALAQLQYFPQRSARPLAKLIRSAGANAKHNTQRDPNTLAITRILVDPGPSYKRMQPRAHGAGFPIAKRMSHVTVYLGERKGKRVSPAAAAALAQEISREEESRAKAVAPKRARAARTRTVAKEKSFAPARKQRVFSRKAI